jgi:hypothetical protein
MSWRLVPDNEEFAFLYRRAEDLLWGLFRAERQSALEPEPWLLPPPLADRAALRRWSGSGRCCGNHWTR